MEMFYSRHAFLSMTLFVHSSLILTQDYARHPELPTSPHTQKKLVMINFKMSSDAWTKSQFKGCPN